MKKLLLGTVALIAIAGTASAADLRMPVKAPPVVAPVFSWTGCYIGGYVGGAWRADDGDTVYYDRLGVRATRGWGYSDDSSFIGGGTLGCNWQPVGSNWVLGLEGEIGYLSLEGSANDPSVLVVAPNYITASGKVGDWYGMITGRLGYAWDRALVYVKGGAAFVDTETTIAARVGANTFLASTSDTQATWTVGGGIEWAFDMNWSIKAEYMYIGVDQTHTVCGNGVAFATTDCFDTNVGGIHTAKIGLNYRFGGGAPVVARY
ncbi:outer membrane protein [Rhodoplanes azumiensis]|uniref:Outer membrane protein n=1 Tax=Rhodoplanes azumiensis TaxID=1897628 RepID=A0ABW5AKD8_9BRAD